VIFYEFPHEPLELLSERFYREKFSAICVKEIFLNNASHIRLTAIATSYHDGNLGYNPLLPQVFSVEIPSWVGFEATTYCCLRPFSVGIPSWMGF
jgi:hypothetical protein